jgi:hypothetical protein
MGGHSDQFVKFEASDEPDEAPTELLSKVIGAHIKEHKNIWKPKRSNASSEQSQ